MTLKTAVIQKDLQISVLSSVISDLAYGVFNPNKVIKLIYPDKPKIKKNLKKEEERPSSALFYSCFDSWKIFIEWDKEALNNLIILENKLKLQVLIRILIYS